MTIQGAFSVHAENMEIRSCLCLEVQRLDKLFWVNFLGRNRPGRCLSCHCLTLSKEDSDLQLLSPWQQQLLRITLIFS